MSGDQRFPRRLDLDRRQILAALAGAVSIWSGHSLAASDEPARRIVAAGGAITEIAYALGRQDAIVGVDTTSQFPPQALRDKPGIGYLRALSAEGVLSLRPNLLLAVEGAGPPDALALIRQSGVPIRMVPENHSAEGVLERIAIVGEALDAADAASRLAASCREAFAALDTLRTKLPGRRKVLFMLSQQNGRIMVGGRNTAADAMIALAGAENVAVAIEGYKPMTPEAILAASPAAIVMMRNSSAHNTTAEELFAIPAFAQTPAAAKRELVTMDALYLLGFGPRTPWAARDLMAALNPDLAIPALPASR